MIRSRTPDIRDQDDAKSSLFRKYTSAIDKVLQSFSTVASWPDNIAFLNKLLKTIQTYPSLPLPRALDISTCLALCLGPQLPSGVHAKTLDLFSHIFSSRQILERDVSLFMVGLIPVLGYASSTVKVQYINLLSTFLVPLGARLAEFARALILALLPGLEDEHDESFDLCYKLLDDVRCALKDDAFFFGSFWLSTMTTTSANRSGSLNYLSRGLHSDEPDISMQEGSACMGPDTGVFCRALATGLTDEDPLVQRGFLELLLAHFHLNSSQILSLPSSEREILLFSATTIVLRKDVSLNRRLWIWLSGPPELIDKDNQISPSDTFFSRFASKDLSKAVLTAAGQEPARTAKIVLSLLDRGDVGGHIIDSVFPGFVKIAYENSLGLQSVELSISIKALLEAVPVEIIDSYLSDLFAGLEFRLAEFMFENFALLNEDLLHGSIVAKFIKLLHLGIDNEEALHFAETIAPHLSTYDLRTEILERTIERADTISQHQTLSSSWSSACFEALSTQAASPGRYYRLLGIRLRLGEISTITTDDFVDFANRLFLTAPEQGLEFVHLSGIAETLILLRGSVTSDETILALKRLTIRLCDECWANLGSTKLRYEISCVHILAKLCQTLTEHEAETILSLKVSEDLGKDSPIEKFAALWMHLDVDVAERLLRRSTVLVLDSLHFGSSLVKGYILRWLKFAHQPSCLMVNFLLSAIYMELPHTKDTKPSTGEDDRLTGILVYHVQLLCNLLQVADKDLLLRYSRTKYASVDYEFLTQVDRQEESSTYLEVIAITALHLLRLRPSSSSHDFIRDLFQACSDILSSIATLEQLSHSAWTTMIDGLGYAIAIQNFDLQKIFLRSLSAWNFGKRSSSAEQDSILLTTILDGLALARQHPVLQDYLSFVHGFIGLNDLNNVMSISDCIIEQIDLNLIDIDACLTTNLASVETSTAFENLVLYLESLELTSLAILQSNTQKDSSSSNVSPNLPSAFAFVRSANAESDQSIAPKSQDISVPLQSTLRVTIGVWNWSANNISAELHSVRYIASSLEETSRVLIEKILQAGARTEFLEVLVDVWTRSSEDNRNQILGLFTKLTRSDGIEIVCRHLKGKLNFGTGAKGVKELQIKRSMRFAQKIIEAGSLEEISPIISELSALLRHIVLYTPFSNETNVVLTQFITRTAIKALASKPAQTKKIKKDISDSVNKVLQLVISAYQESLDVDSKMVNTFSKDVVPQLPAIFLDMDRVASLVSYLMINMLQPQLRLGKLSCSLLELLVQMSSLDNVRKAWRKEFQEFFLDVAFFKVPEIQAQSWVRVVGNWVNGDKEKIDEYLIKSNPSAPGNLFNSADTERQYNCAQLRRATVILLSMPKDTMLSKLPTIFERYRDSCNSHIDLQVEALLCIQAVLVKVSSVHLKNDWPLMITELRAIIVRILAVKEFENGQVRVVKAVLETIDLLLFLRPAAFQTYLWVFIDDAKRRVFSSTTGTSETLLDQLSAKLETVDTDVRIRSLVAIPSKQEMNLKVYVRDVHMLYHERLYDITSKLDTAMDSSLELVTRRLFNE